MPTYCIYCDREIFRNGTGKSKGKQTFNTFTIDHLIPLDKGGNNLKFNRVPCCNKCNGEKSNKTLEEYKEFLNSPKGRFKSFIDKKLRSLDILIKTKNILGERMLNGYKRSPVSRQAIEKKILEIAELNRNDLTLN